MDYKETFASIAKNDHCPYPGCIYCHTQLPSLSNGRKKCFLTWWPIREFSYDYFLDMHVGRIMFVVRENLSLDLNKPRAWFDKSVWFDKSRSAILRAYSCQSPCDISIFIWQIGHSCTILLLYNDDMLISGNVAFGIVAIKTHLMSNVEMEDLGPLTLLVFRFHSQKMVFISIKENMLRIYSYMHIWCTLR